MVIKEARARAGSEKTEPSVMAFNGLVFRKPDFSQL